jgi:membrane protease YdiL (CAAX protease family)
MTDTFAALACAIVAVPVRWPGRFSYWPPAWALLFLVASVLGIVQGVLQWPGALALLLLAGLLYLAARQKQPFTVYHLLAAVLTFALGAHRVPGFHNPILFNAIRITADAGPYTFYLNFDKAGAGLLLYAFLARRATSGSDLRAIASAVLTATPLACLVLAVVGTCIGWFQFEPKFPSITGLWMLGNLLFVAVAEDCFCRVFIQEPLHQSLRARSGAFWLPTLVAAIFFGAIHFAGGWQYVLLASIGGLANAWSYARSRCVEAGVLVHFLTNSAHFLLFTYPYLQH